MIIWSYQNNVLVCAWYVLVCTWYVVIQRGGYDHFISFHWPLMMLHLLCPFLWLQSWHWQNQSSWALWRCQQCLLLLPPENSLTNLSIDIIVPVHLETHLQGIKGTDFYQQLWSYLLNDNLDLILEVLSSYDILCWPLTFSYQLQELCTGRFFSCHIHIICYRFKLSWSNELKLAQWMLLYPYDMIISSEVNHQCDHIIISKWSYCSYYH